jgi:hypothetical protein
VSSIRIKSKKHGRGGPSARWGSFSGTEEGVPMSAAMKEKKSLVQTLVDEASDVDLVCYLVRSSGVTALKDLFECVRDAESLSADDLLYNINLVRQKKIEACACPLHPVLQRLMRSDALPVISSMDETEFTRTPRLH